jgi:cyclic pyranopterin phosphate synthase
MPTRSLPVVRHHAPITGRVPSRWPTYVRVVLTAECPLACAYCHQEGDAAVPGRARGLETEEWITLLGVALDLGAKKIKFLGGEPLLRRDLPSIVAALRARDASADLSVITSGAVPADRLDRLYEAGLSRCNVSIHGFGATAFAERTQRGHAQWQQRNAFLEAARAHGRPLKTNYVYRGPEDDEDLRAYLAFAAERGLLVNVLDDLGRADLDASVLERVVVSMRGTPERRWVEPDPHSLPTLRLAWTDGLAVELKDQRLGVVAPWTTCEGCSARSQCREGIFALRVGHTGELRPCMDRPDLGVDLAGPLRRDGLLSARARYRVFVSEVAR